MFKSNVSYQKHQELIILCVCAKVAPMFEKGLKMMELYIETLTGTAFELRVSPYETVQDVKARIQKLEGTLN